MAGGGRVRRRAAGLKKGETLKTIAKPTDHDRFFYLETMEGLSPEQVAAKYGTSLKNVETGIQRVRSEKAKLSSESVRMRVIEGILNRLIAPMEDTLIGAMGATLLRDKKSVQIDPMTGELVSLGETYEVPDHETRIAATVEGRKLLEAILPKAPLIDQSQPHNTLNVNLPPGATSNSAEAIVRRVRERQGLALVDGSVVEGEYSATVKPDVDTELEADGVLDILEEEDEESGIDVESEE